MSLAEGEMGKKGFLPDRSAKEHIAIVGACVAMGGISAVTQINEGVAAMVNAAGVQTAYSLTSAYFFFEAMQKYLVERDDRIRTFSSKIIAMFGPAVATTLLNFLLHSLTTFEGDKDPLLASAATFAVAAVASSNLVCQA